MKYRVEVAAPLPDDLEGAAARVAAGFGIPAERVMALLRRAPGVVTKPIDAGEATRVVQAFADVGIAGRMLPYDPAAPTVLDSVLDAAGSEPARSVLRRRSATPPAPAVLPPAERPETPSLSPEALAAALDAALPTGSIETLSETPPPPTAPPAAPPETLSEAPLPTPDVRRASIVPRLDDGHALDTGELGDLDLTDPGLGERSRRIYAALDAAIEKAEAEKAAEADAAAAATAEAARADEPPLIVARDLHDLDEDAAAASEPTAAEAEAHAPEAATIPEAIPEAPPETGGAPEQPAAVAAEPGAEPPSEPAAPHVWTDEDDDGFDADAFTRALLDEHGLDESLLDGVESEAEMFDLRDRAERLTVDEGGEAGATRKQRSPFLSRVEEPAVGERGAVAVPIGLDSDDPQALPLPRESDPGRRRTPRPRRRTGLRSKVLLAGLFPALLTAVFALAAVALTVRPLLQGQDGSAVSAASAFAAALSTRQVDAALDSAAVADELQRAALLARATLVGEGIELLLVVDPTGAPLVGWNLGSVDPQRVAQDAGPLVTAALAATIGAPADGPPVDELPARAAAVPLQVGGSAVGVVLAVEAAPPGGALRNLMLILLAAVAIPLLIAFVVSGALTGSLLQNLESLTRAADRISRGKLGRPVELDTGDELSDLAKAIERMRISLEEGMERLRRRRL